jgi:hypothetical protein
MAFNIPNLAGLAAEQSLFATESRIAESTRRQTELLADRAGANFAGLGPSNFFVPLGAEFGNLNAPGAFPAPASFGFGDFAPLGGAAFPAPAPFDAASSAQLFSQQMLGSFTQLAGGWESLLGTSGFAGASFGGPSFGAPGGSFGLGMGLAGFGSPGSIGGAPPPRCL